MTGVNICFSGVYSTTDYIKPENQGGTGVSLLSLRDNTGSVVAALTTTNNDAPLGGVVTATARSVGVVSINVPSRYGRDKDVLVIDNASYGNNQDIYVKSDPLVAADNAGGNAGHLGHLIKAGGTMDWPIGDNGTTVYIVTASLTSPIVWSVP